MSFQALARYFKSKQSGNSQVIPGDTEVRPHGTQIETCA